ncbi:MAG: iron ABC transporter permease [Thermoleophilia bacterium]
MTRRRAARGGAGIVAGAAFVIAALVVIPLATLVGSLARPATGTWRQLWDTILPGALRDTLLLAMGVGVLSLLLGTALAVLVVFYDFPFRGIFEWALVLPLAVPGYVLTFVLVRQWDGSGPVSSALRQVFGDDGIRSVPGAIVVLSLVLYPYVYVLARSAFLGQSRSELEAAQSLGLSRFRAILRIALPTARPTLAAGVALAVMESVADFGTVNLLRVQTLTEAIYRTWYGEFDRRGAIQLASLLLGAAALLLLVEHLGRGRARFEQQLRRGTAGTPVRLTGARAWLATAAPAVVLTVVVLLPGAQLVVWAGRTLSRDGADRYWSQAASSVLLAAAAAAIACAAGLVLAYAQRMNAGGPALRVAARVAGSGYALPGAVVAVAAITVYEWTDDRLLDIGRSLGWEPGLIFTGTALGLLLAYLMRFVSVALNTVDAHLTRIPTRLDEASAALGVTGVHALRRVHLPLLRPGLLAAALLVFVDVVKELPITALLRPLGWDTLAVGVWEATSDARYDAAALPALTIVLVGIIPVVVLVRAARVNLH